MRAVRMIGFCTLLGACATASAATAPAHAPQTAVTHHVLQLGAKSVPYTAAVAENVIDDRSGVAGAAVITIAYTREDVGRAHASLAQNPDCPVDDMDLVFIDPVSTGFSRAFPGDDATNTQYPYYASNAQHSLSAQYQVTPQVTVRAGIINLTNAEPSYPSVNYGDILGRRFFVGVNAHL